MGFMQGFMQGFMGFMFKPRPLLQLLLLLQVCNPRILLGSRAAELTPSLSGRDMASWMWRDGSPQEALACFCSRGERRWIGRAGNGRGDV